MKVHRCDEDKVYELNRHGSTGSRRPSRWIPRTRPWSGGTWPRPASGRRKRWRRTWSRSPAG